MSDLTINSTGKLQRIGVAADHGGYELKEYLAGKLRDAGHEVIYTGIRRTPEQIVAAAVQEDVDAIGLSLLSGSHNVLFARVLELLKARQADDILLFGGGVIPADDVDRLLALGVKAVFTPGTPATEIIGRVEQILSERACS